MSELRREKSRNAMLEKRFSNYQGLQETVEEFEEKNKRLTELKKQIFRDRKMAWAQLKRQSTQISRLQGKTGSSCSKDNRSKLAPAIRELIEDAEFDRDQAFVELDNMQQKAAKAFVESKKGSVERTLLEAVGKKGEHYDFRVIELSQNLSSRGMNAEQVAGALNAILAFEAHSDAKGGDDRRLIDARRVREWSEWIYPMMRYVAVSAVNSRFVVEEHLYHDGSSRFGIDFFGTVDKSVREDEEGRRSSQNILLDVANPHCSEATVEFEAVKNAKFTEVALRLRLRCRSSFIRVTMTV